jgi:hypothetical protein
MTFRHFYDDDGSLHYAKHGVTQEEVEEALHAPIETLNGQGGSKTAIGQTAGGRYVFVVYIPDEGGKSAFVVTARELDPHAREALNRRMKKRNKQS